MSEGPLPTWLETWPPWLGDALLGAAAVLLGLVVQRVGLAVVARVAARTASVADDAFVKHCAAPLRLVVPLLFLNLVAPVLRLGTTPALGQCAGGRAQVLGHGLSLQFDLRPGD